MAKYEYIDSLIACQPHLFRVTTDAEAAALMPDLAKRDFNAARPGIEFVGEITYIHTWHGFIYLATVIDRCSKRLWAGRSPITCAPSSSPTH